MHNPPVQSAAFRQAHLKSERLRLLIVLGVLGIAFLLRSVRILIHGGDENVELWLATPAVLAPFAAYEFLMLLAVNRAHEQQRELPNAAWIGNILAENVLAALGIVLTSSSSIDPTYRAGALAQDIGEGRFVMFVAAVCSPRSSQVELLSAGHGPLLVYKVSHDRIDETEAQGLPLGILPNLVTTPPVILDFHPGDMLVLATDGFFELANPKGDEFGVRRIGEIVRQAKAKPPRELISAMYQAVIEFSEGTRQQDDLTAVVLKRV